jgi:hypothetical protein
LKAWLGSALFLVKPKILMGSHQCKLYCMDLRGVFDDVLGLVKPKKLMRSQLGDIVGHIGEGLGHD